MAHRYGSRVLIEQVKQAVEATGGQFVELPTTTSTKSVDESSTEATPMPCLANFPDGKGRDQFIDSVRRLALHIQTAPPPPHQSTYKVSVNMVVPTTFETTSFLGNIPKTRILALALLKKRRDEVKRPEKSALWSQYDLEYGEACANVLEQFGYSSNLETNEELQRMILETLEEMKAQKNAPHPTKP